MTLVMARGSAAVFLGTVLTLFMTSCGSTSDTADGPESAGHDKHYCAHNADPNCPTGSYVGPHAALDRGVGHWDANGQPVNGGPVGADGSTGNNLTLEYCARHEDPACPAGSFVAADAIPNPDGSASYVTCEGTICTNPNHGAGGAPGAWDANGQPVNGGPTGADGSTGNNLTQEYCAQTEDPACPAGSYVHPYAIPNPDGSNSYVPCEGTICTNPNHGGGDNPAGADSAPEDTAEDTEEDTAPDGTEPDEAPEDAG
ncbi:hypothetical protein ABQE92_02915 [Mycolicibacterium thermoresistibile]